MALSASTVFEVRTAGNDTNGGGFVTGAAGTDYSQQDSKNTVGSDISTTDAVAVGSTTITSLTGNFGTTIVGNIIYFSGGTGSITGQWRQVTARASTTSITIDASIAASTGMTMNIGGALLSPSIAGSAASVSGMITFIKSGTYLITTATTATAGGCIVATNGTLIVGYSTNRFFGNTDTKPLLQLSSVSSANICAGSSVYNNLDLDGNSQTTSKYCQVSSTAFINCIFRNFTAAGNGICYHCYGTGCSSTVFSGAAFGCEATGNTATPFATGGAVAHCISYSNTGGSTNGFAIQTGGSCINCVAYNNGNHGFSGTNQSGLLINCHAEGNVGRGFNLGTLVNCSAYNNTAGATSGLLASIGLITPTGSVFTNAAGGDFSLNNTASQGTLLRNAGYPTSLPNSGTVNYDDVGAARHIDPAGGSGMLYVPNLGGT